MAKTRSPIDMWSAMIIFSLVMVDIIVWSALLKSNSVQPTQKYIFKLSKSTSTLMVLPHNIKILMDPGEDSSIVEKMDGVMSSTGGNYIDLAIISSPQLENYGGYDAILDHYSVGAFIYNGRNDFADKKAWSQLLDKIAAKHIPLITLGKGDSIRYSNAALDITGPSPEMDRSADINDTAILWTIR